LPPPSLKQVVFKMAIILSCFAVWDTPAAQAQIPTQCTNPDCNLVCFGDFEDFTPAFGTYHDQLGVNQFYIQNSTNTLNTVDVITDLVENTTALRWIRVYAGGATNLETARIPLSTAIPVGCTINIRYRATAAASGSNQPNPFINIWGLSGAPCSSISEPVCSAQQFQLCNNPSTQAFRLDCRSIPLDAGVTSSGTNYSGLDFRTYTVSVTNTSGAPITDLLLYGEAPQFGNSNYQFFVDDLVVTNSCQPQLTVQPTVLDQCIEGQAVVRYEVCLRNAQGGTVSATLQAEIPAGLTIVSGGGFNQNGQATIALTPGSSGVAVCTTLTLTMNVGSNFTPGAILNVGMNGTSQQFCVNSIAPIPNATLVLEDCAPTDGCSSCTGGTPTFYVGSGENSTRFLSQNGALNIGSIFNACIIVQGRFVLDADLSISSSRIIMNKGAELDLANGVTLTMEDNVIEGCNHMWKGIKVNEDAYLDMEKNQIKDAQYAVHAFNRSQIRLVGNTFDRNYVGVRVPPSATSPGSQLINSNGFINNKFYCTGNLKTPFAGQAPTPGTVTLAGVELNDVSGLPIGPYNTFGADNQTVVGSIANGVIAYRSELYFSDNLVQNMVGSPNPSSASAANRHGVWAKDCIYGLIYRNTMNGVRVGVYADNTSVYISKNAINGLSSNTANALDVGIEYQNGDDRDIQIFDNTIVTWDSGIKIRNCLNPAVLSVGDPMGNYPNNRIDILGSELGYGGIDLQNCNNGSVAVNRIRNTSTSSLGSGLVLVNCRNMLLDGNDVTNFPVGFGILGSPNNRFTTNAAYSLGFGTTPAAAFVNNTGFLVGSSPECFYCNNYTRDQDEDSWAFSGGCNMSKWSCNLLDDANRGLFLSAKKNIVTVIGPQYLEGNDWFGTYSNLGAFHGSNNSGTIVQSRFTTTPAELPSWSTGLGPLLWFQQFSGDTTVPCSAICGVTLPLNDTVGYYAYGPGHNASGIANGEIEHEGVLWILQQNLYERLHQNTATMGTDADVIGFYQHADTTTIGDLHRVRAQLNTMLKGDLSILAFSDSLVGSLRILSDSLVSLHDAGPGSDEQSWQNHIQRLGNQLTVGTALYYELQDSLHEGRLTDAAGIISANSTIVTNTVPAANEKALNALYLSNQLWTGTEPSALVLAAVKSIADQCAYDGGYPVYWARGLYNGYVPSANWDDDVLCGEEERPTSSEQQAVQAGKVQLIPNPADGYVLIVSKDAAAEAMLQITSANGAVVSDVPLPTGTSTQRIGTQQLPAGVYFYRLIAQGSQVQAGKLIIKH